MNYFRLKIKIKKNEGFRNESYLDSLGFATIGFGHLIKREEGYLLKGSFSKKYLLNVFNVDFNNAVNDYNNTYKKTNFPPKIQEILIEMIFQLGIKKQKKFLKMNYYLKKNSKYMAALEMKNSLWYKQTPKRVEQLIKKLLGSNER